jgi:hypothetical protein
MTPGHARPLAAQGIIAGERRVTSVARRNGPSRRFIQNMPLPLDLSLGARRIRAAAFVNYYFISTAYMENACS